MATASSRKPSGAPEIQWGAEVKVRCFRPGFQSQLCLVFMCSLRGSVHFSVWLLALCGDHSTCTLLRAPRRMPRCGKPGPNTLHCVTVPGPAVLRGLVCPPVQHPKEQNPPKLRLPGDWPPAGARPPTFRHVHQIKGSTIRKHSVSPVMHTRSCLLCSQLPDIRAPQQILFEAHSAYPLCLQHPNASPRRITPCT